MAKLDTDISKVAVVYARFSSHRQGEQSVEGQLSAAKAYAAKKGYTIIHEYVDRAVSGRSDDRDAFQQMLTDTAKRQFSVVIIWKIDRFGRNREEIAMNRYRCRKNGVRIEYTAESVPDSPEGVILESVLEGMAEYYSLQLSQNITRGNRVSASKCQALGGRRPLGYTIDPATKKYIPDPATAPVVQMIYRLYAEGNTTPEIIRELNSQGFMTAQRRPFTKNSLRTILKNEMYTGVYTYKDELRIEGGVPAIIDRETFDTVQELMQENRKAPARTWNKAEYLLSGKLFCGHCGAEMIGVSGHGKSGAKYGYYQCWNRHRHKTCQKRNIRSDVIEQIVMGQTVRILQDDALMDYIVDQTWSYYIADDSTETDLAAMRGQLVEVERGIDNLVRAAEMGFFSESTRNRLAELERQKSELHAAIAETELMRSQMLTKDFIRFWLEQFRSQNYHSRSVQKRLVKTFINAVFLYDDRLIIGYNYTSTPTTITLADVDGDTDAPDLAADSAAEVFDRCALLSTRTRTVEHFLTWAPGVFLCTMKLPPD